MISDQQIDFIEQSIADSQVKSKELRDDLLDHMCCLVEIEMKKGLTFDQAYQKAFLQTSPNGYGEIQNETLFLLNYNKIMNMKRFTYLSGFVFSMGFSFGCLFKIMHWPWANMMMSIGLIGAAFVFVPMLLINKYKTVLHSVLSEKMKWVFGVISLLLLVASAIFKINHLMGANVLLMSAFLIFGFGFLPFLFFRMYKQSIENI
ncbi:MAG: hypothetical protein RJQ14_05240 [Marinoscillum sp.]